MFRVGQKVVCVNAGNFDGSVGTMWADGDAPVEGEIYTIARIFHDEDGTVFDLIEIERGPIARKQWGDSAGYNARRFRPAVERKTDISIFTAMLTPKKQRERA